MWGAHGVVRPGGTGAQGHSGGVSMQEGWVFPSNPSQAQPLLSSLM